MLTFRGDVHRFYLKVKKAFYKKRPISELPFIKEVAEIEQFYEQLSYHELKRVRLRIVKEKNGAGVIPLLISTIPWLGLIFSKQIQNFIEKNLAIVITGLIFYTVAAFIAIFLHFKEQAWANTHSEIIDEVIHKKIKAMEKNDS